MKDIIIFGPNNFGKLLKYYIDIDDQRNVAAFTVDKEYFSSDIFCGLEVVVFDELKYKYPPDKYDILLAIGYSDMNNNRKKIFNKCKERGYNIASFIHSSCHIYTDEIGEGNIMLDNCIVYPFAKIGDCNLLWSYVEISHDCVVGNYNTFSSKTNLSGYIEIGNNCFFGKSSVIREYTKIANYTLIGALAFCKNDTNEYDVIVPASSKKINNKNSIDLI